MKTKTFKESKLSFGDGFLGVDKKIAQSKGKVQCAFDYDKAGQIIKDYLKDHPDLIAEAGLQGDWHYTGGCIFQYGKPYKDDYTYLASVWAVPTLILSWSGEEQKSFECFIIQKGSRFNADSKWDDVSLKILGINF